MEENIMEESIRKDWRETRFNTAETPVNMRDIMDGRRKSALENLARRYRTFSIIGFVMAFVSINFLFSPIFVPDLRVWVVVAMMGLFLLAASIDDWFCRGIQAIDVAMMPIAEVAAKALYFRKKHLQSVAVLLPIAILIIGLMAYASTGDWPILAGMGCGGVVGLVIGLRQLSRFMADYRSLSE